MCSTPRSSGSAIRVCRRTASSSRIQAALQMMRIASELYEKKLAERAKRRAGQILEKEIVEKRVAEDVSASIVINHSKMDRLKHRISHFVHSIGLNFFPSLSAR